MDRNEQVASKIVRLSSRMCIVLVVGLLGATAVPAVAAPGPVGDQFRVSSTGSEGDASRDAFNPAFAVDTRAGGYLAVWESDNVGANNKLEISAQRISSSGGVLGSPVRVSTTGADSDATRQATNAAVAYNSAAGEYLVVWQANPLPDARKVEIFAQRVSSDGALIGGPIQVSSTGSATDPSTGAETPAVAYDPETNEYLVTWDANGAGGLASKFEIFAQRISGAGALVGGTFQVSATGSGSDPSRDAFGPSVSYASGFNQFLVVWRADAIAKDNKFEVFARRVSAGGALLGAQVRISFTGSDADVSRDAFRPSVAYASGAGQYLVAWRADPLAVNDDFEIFAQRLSSAAALVGGRIRVSTTGPEGNPSRAAIAPAVTYSSAGDEYLVAWEADGLPTDNKLEIFASRISGGGALLQENVRVSVTGLPTDAARDAFNAAVAYNPGTNEYLVGWRSDALPAADKFEVFARRFTAGLAPPPPPPPPSSDTTLPIVRVRALPHQRVVRARALRVRIWCNERCTARTRGWVFTKRKPTRFLTNRVTRQIAPPKPVMVRLRLSRKATIAIRRALAHHRRVTIRVTVVATDWTGNRRTVRPFIRITR